MQVGGLPEADDALSNWHRLLENDLEYPNEEDRKVVDYLRTFYSQMAAPPDFTLVKEYFEKKDEIETVARLDEIKKSQVYIRTNFLSIVRSEREQQSIKNLVLVCRDAQMIAEHGRNLDKPVNGKKIIRGVQDAINYLFERTSGLASIENGEKLEGDITEDAEEVLEEYDQIAKTNKYAGRNLFGLEPVDFACKGHKAGEYWIHTAFTGELKCLPGDATILDHSSRMRRTLVEVYESGKLPTVTALQGAGQKNRLVPAKASHVVQNGIRDVFTVRLSSGRKIASTDNHGFLTPDGWKELKHICVGDFIGVPNVTRVSDPTFDFTDEEVRVVGYLLGDGYVGGERLTLTATNDEIRADFSACLRAMGMREGTYDGITPSYAEEFPKDRAPGVRVSSSRGRGNAGFISPVRELLESLGVMGKVASTKRIPDEFFFLPENQIALLLGALWSTDGSFHCKDHERKDRTDSLSKRNDIRYHSTSEGLCLDVQSLLLRLGINSSVDEYFTDYDGSPYKAYVTRVTGAKSKLAFLNNVHVVGKRAVQIDMLERVEDLNDERFPSTLIPDGAKALLPNGKFRYSSQCRRDTVAGSVLEVFSNVLPRLRDHLEGDVRWDRVESVTLRGREMTYDVSVPDHRSLVVNDVITHNTTVALNYLYNNTYLYEKNIFYAILEMPYKQLRRQMYVLHSSHGKFITDWYQEDKRRGVPEADRYMGLDYRKVRDGELDELGLRRLRIVAQDYKATRKGRPYIWRPESDMPTVGDIKRKAEMFHNKYGCDGIIIDHLGLVKPKFRTNDHVTMINSVVQEGRMLALNFARGKTVPVLALFQLNRQGKLRADKADGRYDIAAISYANEVEKSADYVTYTYLNDELRRQGKFYFGCMKNRDNPVFERMVGKVLWQTKRMRALEAGMLDVQHDHAKLKNAVSQITSLQLDDVVNYMTGT